MKATGDIAAIIRYSSAMSNTTLSRSPTQQASSNAGSTTLAGTAAHRRAGGKDPMRDRCGPLDYDWLLGERRRGPRRQPTGRTTHRPRLGK